MGGRILLVPGRWALPPALVEGLEGRGHLVAVRALSPQSAAAAAAGDSFDLAVVRHGEGSDGGAVVLALKRGAPALPVLLLLRDDPERLGADPGPGAADRIIVEPVDPPVLAMVVAVLLARRAAGLALLGSSREPLGGGVVRRPEPQQPREPLPGRRRKRVVVVDDDRAALGYVRLVLDKRGADVLAFGSARELLDAAPRGPFDLVLVDRLMPGTLGHDLLFQLRGEPEFHGAKFLVLSQDASPEVEQRSLAMGADGFVSKPVRASRLAQLFEELRP